MIVTEDMSPQDALFVVESVATTPRDGVQRGALLAALRVLRAALEGEAQ